MTVTAFPRSRPTWWNQLDIGRTGSPLTHYRNAIVAIRNDTALNDAIAYDEMMRLPMLQHRIGSPLDTQGYPRPVTDADVRDIQEWMQDIGIRGMGLDNVWGAVTTFALENAYHPVLNYLENLVPDDENRLDIWLAKYLGAKPCPYTAEVGKRFLISMVARIYEPGCKADYMLVLEGQQGTLKSSALAALAREWFSDSLPEIGESVEVSTHLRGKWLIEIAEMYAIFARRIENAQLKSFLSRAVERFRPKWGRAEVIEPRQCVFCGTTNQDQYLRDETGNRRFWPVQCGKIDLEALTADRDLLFAEAVARYKSGEPWWPTPAAEEQFIKPQQTFRYVSDTWEDLMREWLDGKVGPIHLKEIVCGCLGYFSDSGSLFSGTTGIPYSRLNKADHKRIRDSLEAIGWISDGRDMRGALYRKR